MAKQTAILTTAVVQEPARPSFVFPLALASGLIWMGLDVAPAVESATAARDEHKQVLCEHTARDRGCASSQCSMGLAADGCDADGAGGS
jgi:hypothetical protein